MAQIRQGDVLIESICGKVDLSQARPIAPEHGRLVLARGEATGHHHSVDAATAQLFALDGRMVLVVAEPSVVNHQEHGALSIAPGMYWVVTQYEYSPAEIRRVAD